MTCEERHSFVAVHVGNCLKGVIKLRNREINMRVKQAEKEMMMMLMMMVKKKNKVCGGEKEMDTDQESVGSSSEEMDSPRSVVPKLRRNNVNGVGLYQHSQILRIRDEDAHIGEDFNIAELLNNLCVANKQEVASPVMVLSRPLLRASPLSGKDAAIKAAD